MVSVIRSGVPEEMLCPFLGVSEGMFPERINVKSGG